MTGVRDVDATNVILTGTNQNDGTQAFLYEGPLAGGGTTYLLTPTFAGQTVTGSTFYGPNTNLYDPTYIPAGQIFAVGSYQTAATGIQDHGMLYEGTVSGSGVWINIDMSSSIAGGTVGETIPHSTMGNLIVGDYDLSGEANSANAFLYNITTNSFTALNIGGLSNDTTAYGIWENSDGTYTIAGGTQDGVDINKAFLINYNESTNTFSDLTYYAYSNTPGSINHFEGITGTANGYNLIATTDDGAALASVTTEDGTYGAITWTGTIAVPTSTGSTTGNSVYDDTGMGIYQTADGVQSYIVSPVPEPSTNFLLLLSFSGLAFLYFRHRRSV